MILDSFKLNGRVALVTGAARGIGQAIAIGLAEAGADLALLDRLPQDDTRATIQDAGRSCSSTQMDLGELDADGAELLIASVAEQHGRLDILVNNAGIIRRSRAEDYSQSHWEEVLQTNLSSAFYLSQAAARHFLAAGRPGKIINVCSMLSFQGGASVVAYTAAKSGLAGITRALANEWAGRGINVNAIAPGYLATDVTAGIRADPRRDKTVLSRIPAGRWGEPEDVQGAVIFLASAAAAYIHGVILPVDGGWLAW